MKGVAVEISNDIKPGLVVVIGYVDHQRVSLPVAARVPHPQLDAVSNMRTPIKGDDARTMVELLQDHDVSRRLKNLKSPLIKYAWYAAEKTTRVWVNVLPLGQVRVVVKNLLPFRPGPRLVRNSPVRRIHNQTLLVGLHPAKQNVRFIRSLLDVIRGQPSPLVRPKPLNVRLAIRRSGRVPGLLRSRCRLASGGDRHQRQDSRRGR